MDIYLITKYKNCWQLTKDSSDLVIVSAKQKKEVIYKANVFLKDKSCLLKIYSHDGKFQENRSFPKTNSWKILS